MGLEELLGKGSKGSNSTIIWILLFIVIFGFGKGRTLCGFQPVNACEDDKHKGKSHSRSIGYSKNICPAPYPAGGILGGLGLPGFGGPGGLLGGNGAFLLVIIVLLFLCKDPKEKDIDEKEEE